MESKALLKQGLEILCRNNNIESYIFPQFDKIILLLNLYIKEIETFNSIYGLVGTNDTNELVIKHILDSLAPLEIILGLLNTFPSLRAPVPPCDPSTNCTSVPPCDSFSNVASVPPCDPSTINIADIGSGAGLPGIPLSILLNQCNFTLIERMGRRAGFLLNTKAVLSLPNITVEEGEMEKTVPGRFDLVTFRAFKPLEPKLFKYLLKACKPGGIIAAYKGKIDKINEEMSLFETQNIDWQAIPYSVPFLEEERHILVIRTK